MMKSKSPVFSVITVVYNDAVNLYKTITSVSQQDYPYVQFIVIDGGSTDDTLRVIRANEQVITLWQSEKDKGIYDAMNKGLTLATGDYVNFLNAGDTFYNPHVLTRVAEEVDSTDGDIIYGQSLHKSQIRGRVSFVKGKIITPNALFRDVPFCHQTLFVKKKLFQEIGTYDTTYRIVADYQWMIRYYSTKKSTKKMHFLNQILVEYDIDGFSFKNIGLAVSEKADIAKKLFTGKYFLTGNVYFLFERIRVLIVIGLYNAGVLEWYRKFKYHLLKKSYTAENG